MSIGEKILQLRRAGGLSQEQLAEILGVSRQAVSKWETDQSAPEIEKVLLLAKAFAVSTDELLGNDIPPSPQSPAPQLAGIVRANLAKRQFTLGWITAVIGLALWILEYFSLWLLRFNAMRLDLEYAAGTGFFDDPMAYARVAPMPAIFAITGGIVVIGAMLTIWGLIRGVLLFRSRKSQNT